MLDVVLPEEKIFSGHSADTADRDSAVYDFMEAPNCSIYTIYGIYGKYLYTMVSLDICILDILFLEQLLLLKSFLVYPNQSSITMAAGCLRSQRFFVLH